MANRFNQLQGNREDFQSLFVPMPLEAITNLAKDYSDRYKAGQALPSEFDQFASTVKYAPIHENLAKSWMQEANKEIFDVVANAKENDWADYGFQRKVQNTINKYKYDPRLNTIRNTYDYWTKEGEKTLGSQEYQSGIQLDKFKNPDGSWKQTDQSVHNIEYFKPEDYIKTVKELMDKPEAYGSDSGSGISKDNQGYFIIKNQKKEYITPEQIEFIAKSNLQNYVNDVGGQYRFRKLLDQSGYDPRMTYNQFMSDPNIKDDVKQRAEKIMLSDLTGYGSKYIHTKVSGNTSMKNDVMTLKKKIDQDNIDKQFSALGKIEGAANTEPITKGQALSNIGIRHSKDDGSIDYSNIHTSLQDIKKRSDDLKRDYEKGNIDNYQYMKQLEILGEGHKMAIANQRKANEHYSDIVSSANRLGFDIDQYKDKNLKVDYERLKNDLILYSSNLAKETSNIDAFQADFKENLSKNYFGEYDPKTDTWSKAPLIDNAIIYAQSKPSDRSKYSTNESKKDLAKTASFIGFDFNAPEAGTLSFVSSQDDKSDIYNAVIPDQTLKTLMSPVHRFTQEYKKAALGKLSQQEITENKNYARTQILRLANHLQQNNDPNFNIKFQKLNDLQSAIANSPGKVVATVNSDGSKLYVGRLHKDDKTQKPIRMAFVIDVRTGDISEGPLDLGKFQQEESAIIQKMIAPGYNKSAEGYNPNDIIFSE